MTVDISDLEAGDIVYVDLGPVRGSEQDGIRPALVLTNSGFHIRDNKAIVCPIMRKMDPWPTKVPLPEGLAVRGCVLIDQVRTLDRRLRGFRRVGRVPPEVLDEVRRNLAFLLGIDPGGY